jgi:hypothetical protein
MNLLISQQIYRSDPILQNKAEIQNVAEVQIIGKIITIKTVEFGKVENVLVYFVELG